MQKNYADRPWSNRQSIWHFENSELRMPNVPVTLVVDGKWLSDHMWFYAIPSFGVMVASFFPSLVYWGLAATVYAFLPHTS